jgi:hypothetical protein
VTTTESASSRAVEATLRETYVVLYVVSGTSTAWAPAVADARDSAQAQRDKSP